MSPAELRSLGLIELMDVELPARDIDLEQKFHTCDTIGLFSGSRDREVERHLPVMLETALILKKRRPELKFVVSVAHTVARDSVRAILEPYNQNDMFELTAEKVARIFDRVKLVLATSGTVTLEAALHGVPQVIIYKVSPVSFLLGRALVQVSHIGLVNLVAGQELVPELVQNDASADNIALAVENMLADRHHLNQLKQQLFDLRDVLGGGGASEKVAELALEMLGD